MDNPYWAVLAEHVTASDRPWEDGAPTVGNLLDGGISRSLWEQRFELASKYAWTITDPESVAFVARQSRGQLIDPLAGTGYWGYLLAQAGVDVVCYDLEPGTNHWHGGRALHMTVEQADVASSVPLHCDRTLLLAWPPMDDAGARALLSYTGDRVIYIGEGNGGCTGDEQMHQILDRAYRHVACLRPVQWWGIHDYINVYSRDR